MNYLSILIPTFNRVELLRHSLGSFVLQNKPENYEIIILNEGTENDGTEKLCNKYKSKLNIRYIFTGHRNKPTLQWRCPGFAFNIGIKQAVGDILILTCPEIIHIRQNCIIDLIKVLFDKNKIIAYPLYVKDDYYGNILNFLQTNFLDYLPEQDYLALPDHLKPYYPFFIGLKKQDIMEIGGYDEGFIGICFDDADIYHRLEMSGCSFRQTHAKVLHLFHKRLDYKNSQEIMKKWELNKKIYEERKNIIVRNEGIEWGIIHE